MKKLFYLTVCAGLIALISGCSGTGRSCFSNPFKGCFKGDACSTCNPPAGQPPNCDSNVAPLCTSCPTGNGTTLPPAYAPTTNNGVPLYGDPSLNAPEFSIPTTQSARPVYPDESSLGADPGYGAVGSGTSNDGVNPPF